MLAERAEAAVYYHFFGRGLFKKCDKDIDEIRLRARQTLTSLFNDMRIRVIRQVDSAEIQPKHLHQALQNIFGQQYTGPPLAFLQAILLTTNCSFLQQAAKKIAAQQQDIDVYVHPDSVQQRQAIHLVSAQTKPPTPHTPTKPGLDMSKNDRLDYKLVNIGAFNLMLRKEIPRPSPKQTEKSVNGDSCEKFIESGWSDQDKSGPVSDVVDRLRLAQNRLQSLTLYKQQIAHVGAQVFRDAQIVALKTVIVGQRMIGLRGEAWRRGKVEELEELM